MKKHTWKENGNLVMSTMEIILLIIGTLVFVVSFFVPETEKQKSKIEGVDEKAIARVVDEKVADAKDRIDGIVDETVQYALEKTERSLERVSNEKIMAVSEFSDTVIKEIDKNHQEVVFLYDMLNNKSVDLKNTVREAEQVKKDTKEMAIESINAIENAFSEMTTEDINEDSYDNIHRVGQESVASIMPDLFEAAEAEAAAAAMEDERVAITSDTIIPESVTFAEGQSEETVFEPEDIPEESAMVAFGFVKEEAASQKNDIKTNKSEVKAEAKAEVKAEVKSEAKAEIKADVKSDKTEVKPKTERKTRARRTTSKRAAAKNLENMDITFDAMGDSGKNKNEKILQLHRQGKSNVEVARELGLGMGEVKLVIDLFES